MTTIFIALLFALAVTLFLWRRGFFQLSQLPIFPLKFWQVGAAFLIYIGITVLYTPLAMSWQKTVPLSWLNLAYLTAIFIALAVYLRLLNRAVSYALFWGGAPVSGKVWWRTSGMGVVTWFLAYPYVMIVNGVVKKIVGEADGEQVAVQFMRRVKDRPILLICTLFFVVVIVPIIEELLFRGFLQTWLRRFCSRFWGIVISSLIFAFVHYAPGQGNYEIIASLFTLALFLGFLYEKERLLWAPIALHGTFNLVSSIVILFA